MYFKWDSGSCYNSSFKLRHLTTTINAKVCMMYDVRGFIGQCLKSFGDDAVTQKPYKFKSPMLM